MCVCPVCKHEKTILSAGAADVWENPGNRSRRRKMAPLACNEYCYFDYTGFASDSLWKSKKSYDKIKKIPGVKDRTEMPLTVLIPGIDAIHERMKRNCSGEALV